MSHCISQRQGPHFATRTIGRWAIVPLLCWSFGCGDDAPQEQTRDAQIEQRDSAPSDPNDAATGTPDVDGSTGYDAASDLGATDDASNPASDLGLTDALAPAPDVGEGDDDASTNHDDAAVEEVPDLPDPLVAYDPNWPAAGVFSSANGCARCHKATAAGNIPSAMRYPDANGDDVSPPGLWRHTVMANAFNDPYFHAKMQDETEVLPQLAGFIEDTCQTCHAPMGRTHAHHTGTGLDDGDDCLLADGCYRYETALVQGQAREGISCTLCHQIEPEGLGTAATYSGEYRIPSASEAGALTIDGPYPSPALSVMAGDPTYAVQYGAHLGQSAFCATCHTLYTPTISVDTGEPTGDDFLEQGPFLEWLNSAFATGQANETHCQGCHMPTRNGYVTPIAIRPNGTVNQMWGQRTPFYEHAFIGGNAHLLDMLGQYRGHLGIASSTTAAGFATQAARDRALLAAQTAQVAIARLERVDSSLEVDVQVLNLTGHKLPTGFPSRRVWVELKVELSGQVLFHSGAADDRGRLGVDTAARAGDCLAIHKPNGFTNTGCYEPHRNVITEPTQIAIYEAVLADTNGHLTHVLLHADSYLKDNRLPPRGFSTSSARFIPDTAPAGVSGDPDFNIAGGQQGSGGDIVHYRIPLGTTSATQVAVKATLHYQAVRPSFVSGMLGEGERIDRYRAMYDAVPPTVETLDNDSRTLNF